MWQHQMWQQGGENAHVPQKKAPQRTNLVLPMGQM